MSVVFEDVAEPVAPPPAFGRRLAPPGDPLEGATFDAIYGQQIEPELVRLEGQRRNALVVFGLGLAASCIFAYLEVLGQFDYRLPLVTVTAGAVFSYLPLHAVGRRAKVAVALALCGPLGVAYSVAGKEPDVFQTFLKLGLLPSPSGKSFEDFFSGQRHGLEFMLCEATLEQGSGKSRRTVFHGQIFHVTTQKKRLARTVVLREHGWMDRFQCPAGLKKVGLEDPHFEEIFEVYGSDQVEAREILTPTFMEQLVALETEFSGKHVRCGFVEGEVLIAIEGGNRFEIGSLFVSLVNKAHVEGIAHDLEHVFALMDHICVA